MPTSIFTSTRYSPGGQRLGGLEGDDRDFPLALRKDGDVGNGDLRDLLAAGLVEGHRALGADRALAGVGEDGNQLGASAVTRCERSVSSTAAGGSPTFT